jgi:hypothetical protein
MVEGRLVTGFLCIAVVATILTLGLWPFHVPANEVVWLKDRAGLGFGETGTAISSGVLLAPNSSESGASVEIWLRPDRIWDSSTFLGLCSTDNPSQLLLRQSQTDLEIQTGQNDRLRARTARLYVNEVFRKPRPVFVTITSGGHGTSVYVDSVLVKTAPRFRLSTERFTGRIVVGDSPGQTDSWRGQIFGLAIYHRELTASEAGSHYLTWTQAGRPRPAADERNVVLYLFDEGGGNVVRNAAGPGSDLQIPAKYVVLDKIFLEPFWQEFNISCSYWSSAVKNVVGFIPLGFCFYACLTAFQVKRARLVTVILGTTVSVIIEVLQAYLPTRDSGTTDIFTNTLGTWIGVASYGVVVSILARTFPAVLVRSPSHRLECIPGTHCERK